MELKPCPFCGKAPQILVLDTTRPASRWIRCCYPRCRVHPSTDGETAKQAARRWNKRFDPITGNMNARNRNNLRQRESGNLKLDVPALAAKIMAERDSALNQGLGFSTVMNEMRTEFAKVSARLDAMTAERDATVALARSLANQLEQTASRLISERDALRAQVERLRDTCTTVRGVLQFDITEYDAVRNAFELLNATLAATAP